MTRSALPLALLAGCPHAPPPSSTSAPPPVAAEAGRNAAACTAYVTAFNTAGCAGVALDAAEVCPASLDQLPCDLGAYFDCMAAAVRCHGEFLDVSGQAQCPPSTCE